MKKLLCILFLVIATFYLSAQEIPQRISYQGKLLENGTPVNGTKSMKFTIGSWNETHSTVVVTEGLYSVTLGENDAIPADVFNSTNVKLKIEVEGVTLSPQTDISSVAFAYKAEKAVDAEEIGGHPVSSSSPSNDDVLVWDGSQWYPQEIVSTPTGDAGGDLDETYPNPMVVKIQSHPVSTDNPSSDEVLKWNGSQWTPMADETLDGSSGGGDLSGTYPDPTVIKIQGKPVSDAAPTTDQVLKWDGSEWTPDADESGGLVLPYSETYNGDSDVFVITSTGANNSNLAYFFVDNQSSNANALYLKTNGTDDALHINNDGTDDAIDIHGDANSSKGVDIHHNGSKESLYVYHEGEDDCTHFQIHNSDNSNDVIVAVTDGTGYVGKFWGNVDITGALSKASGTFKIDHPQDPENKYLYHSFVESPDMMNVYNGNAILDEGGSTLVELPEYFEALNMEFRYQLTCIGGFAQVYISEEVSNNKFKISGGTPNLKVSWQITGIRQDPYANQNRVKVEVEKSTEEKGYYLHYKEYNKPEERSIMYKKYNDLDKGSKDDNLK